MSNEPALMSLVSVAKAIAEKRLSSREVTRSCLDRIVQWQPSLNAFMAIEAEAALAAADDADKALAKGNSRGVLHGVPLAHKDMYYDAGKVVTCGSKIRRDFVATTTATALQRLKDAGTVRLGSLQMAEFAYGPTGHNAHFGPVRNPWGLDHITGGSSSGSGAAVAARLTFAALGSDTGGSVRMPSHFCGVTGLKTTVGRVSRAGAMPLSQSLDTVGPLAQSAEDCALLMSLMAGADPEDPTALAVPVPDYMAATTGSLKGLRIGVPAAFYVDDLDPEVARVLDETIATLTREGAEIVKVQLPDQRQLSSASQIVLAVEAAAFHKRWMIERLEDYGPQVRMRLENGLAIPAITYLEAMRWRGPALSAHVEAVAGVDAVIAPVSPVPAPTIAESDVGGGAGAEAVIQRLTRFTRPVNYLGVPALALPCGFSRSGLPIGMQLIGGSFEEAGLLRIGAAFQRATDFHNKMPKLA
ncbi:MAG TPA: amidase [Bradyrhizobium sp.]|nr:amidase [Bradyrhizobium sp.]